MGSIPGRRNEVQRFFDKHGKAAIFLGRFMPIIRTFIPFTAGVSQMRYRDFAAYNVLGGITWMAVALGAGYLFGNAFPSSRTSSGASIVPARRQTSG